LAAKNIDPLNTGIDTKSIETGAQDWNYSCGVCHVGGGQMEYDRDRNPYSASSQSGDKKYWSYIGGQIVDGFMSDTNKAEVDCLLCHLNDGAGMSGNGRAWLQSMGCSGSMPLGPMNDPACTGTSGMPGVPAAGPFTPGTDYDMYNRNLALKTMQFNLAASMGLGAVATINPATGQITGITGVPATIAAANIQTTPKSQNCSVCHARDDNTPGLPGMINMKYGYGNYAMINPAGTAKDIDKAADLSVGNDVLWFELGCKTGMGKRAHRIGQGPNANWGMSMFNYMFGLGKNPGDPVVTETLTATNPFFAGMQVNTKERMPDVDVHDAGGMQCATCHYVVGSTPLEGGSRTFPAGTHHGVSYPSETVLGIDHNFAQADSLKDTYGKNWLDGTISCESCHTTRTHPRIAKGEINPPIPTHAGFPAIHLEKIACATCHIPETYSAPGRLKYRDHAVGYYKKGVETNGGFRNMLDWNYDLITGSHKTVPNLYMWATKEGETKITPVLPSEMPIWVKGNSGTNGESGTESGLSADFVNVCAGGLKVALKCTADADCPGSTCVSQQSSAAAYTPAPSKSRDVIKAAQTVETAGGLRRANEINGGNMVPLFDGFSLADAWTVDTAARQNAMITAGAGSKLKVFHAAFDVTHGVVAKAWALGGSKRGGCVSCHSSIDKMARNQFGQPIGPNPNYSPNSIGFFESFQQPLENTNYSFGVGQYDLVKNWFSLFADYDCTMMCGMGMQPDTTYFDQAGNPIRTAACGDPFGMGWQNLGHCVDFMTTTFDQAMGFPAGTAAMMGMNDGIAGLQGFTVRETVSGATLGCQPFLGAESFVPPVFTGNNMNNCMPSNNPMFNAGTCVGANPGLGQPGGCINSFRNNGMCFANSDCNGRTWPAAEYAKNPNGLIYQRSEVRNNFKIMLQNNCADTTCATGKLTWPITIEKNPGNPAHVALWDQAKNCVTNMGAPIPCGTSSMACTQDGVNPGTCINVRTWINGNELLGYTPAVYAEITKPALAGVGPQSGLNCTACHAKALNHPTTVGTPGLPTSEAACKTCHLAGTPAMQVHVGATVDVQTACGYCHGGSSQTTHNGAPYRTTADLAVWARSMHTPAPTPIPTGPIVTATSTFSLDGFTATYTDNSTGGSGNLTVKVTWGDGKTSIVVPGSTTTHTYTRARTYNARATVFDMGVNGTLRKTLTAVTATLPVAPLSISGTVRDAGGNPLQGVVMTLKQVTATKTLVRKKAVTRADGTYTFSNVLPNSATGAATSTTPYTLVATKKSFTFPAVGTFSVTNASITGKDVN
jgi:hypothetical protein